MICNIPEVLAIKLALLLADKMTLPHEPRVHRRKVALECREWLSGVSESDRKSVVFYLRNGVEHAFCGSRAPTPKGIGRVF